MDGGLRFGYRRECPGSRRVSSARTAAAVSTRWQGKCDDCGEWNTLVEEAASAGVAAGPVRSARKGRVIALTSLAGETPEAPRVKTGIAEFDRVTGGGFVRGSALLVGGDPGIGKSTLLLQAAGALAQTGPPRRLHLRRGGDRPDPAARRAPRPRPTRRCTLAAETSVEDILATLAERPAAGPRRSSIRSRRCGPTWPNSAPGTVTQVRASAQALIRYAKQTGTAVIFVGHVTKDGQIAGPRVVEHMVDAVLYFEGEGGHHFRILRAVKNRFGPTDEIGVFEMTGSGLGEVANPSELFLGERNAATPGAAVFAGMEGTRPLLVEIQALVAPTTLGTPRRAVVGWDSSRLAMVLAVLEAHCRVRLGDCDVYLNVAGGLRISEPAADLAVAAALVSSRLNAALPAGLRLLRRDQPVRRRSARWPMPRRG